MIFEYINKSKHMEIFNKLRKEWITTLKILKSLSTQTLYFLIEPDDDSKFFDIIDSFRSCLEGTQFSDFQILAIEYLIEYKKQNKLTLKIKTEPYTPNTGTFPWPEPIKPYTKPNTSPDNPYGPLGPVVTYSTSTL